VIAMIPENYRDLLRDDRKAYAFLSTLMEDGSPQVTPVWFDTKGGFIRINTARGRVKDRNLSSRPQVAIAIMDLEEPFRYIQIRGMVESSTENGARKHIDLLSQKYLGEEKYPWYEDEVRVTYIIQPESVSGEG
jgi:PPOX class probable F420-dependent enzyme